MFLITPSGFVAATAVLLFIILNITISLIERKKYRRRGAWFYALKESFKSKKPLTFSKEEYRFYLKYSLLYAVQIYLIRLAAQVVDTFVFAGFIQSLSVRSLIMIGVISFSLFYLTYAAIVRVEKKAQPLFSFTVSFYTIFLSVVIRQLVGIIITLIQGDPWSFWYLLPPVSLLEGVGFFVIPLLYHKLRRKK